MLLWIPLEGIVLAVLSRGDSPLLLSCSHCKGVVISTSIYEQFD